MIAKVAYLLRSLERVARLWAPNPHGGASAAEARVQRYAYMGPSGEREGANAAILKLRTQPVFSVIVPVYNVKSAILSETIASVTSQWYSHWELIVIDDHSPSNAVGTVTGRLSDPRISVTRLAENRGISGATNAGLARATGDYVVFLDHDDELTPDCLYELALCIDRGHPDYVYSDEDKLDVDGTFRDPFFKPDWSPDTMMSIMLTCHVSCVRRSLANDVGGLRSEYDGSQDWDFVLRVTERAKLIAHIPKVLYHWRIIPASCASDLQAKPYAIEASKRAREDALRRRGLSGELVPVPELPGYFRTCYHLQDDPLFSIIIPTKNNGAVLKACIGTIFGKTHYPRFEVVVVNNGSTDAGTVDYLSSLREHPKVMVLDYDAPFNYSKINNYAAQHAHGDIFVFLNDDTEVISDDWLEYMGGYAQLSHVGAVGAKLLYPGGQLVQHVGVLNLAPGPAHAYARFPAHAPGYFVRNMLEYDWIAITGACMMLERSKFDACGGFDEDLAVAYNDTALCFSLGERGLYQVVCPGVELIHHESLTRGDDTADPVRRRRLDHERELAFQKHPTFKGRDPFHNPNLDPNDAHFGLRFGSHAFERSDPDKLALVDRPARGRCVLDLVDPVATGCAPSKFSGTRITFAGWASDGKGAPAGVFALVLRGDHGTYCAWTRTGIARPDVAVALRSKRLGTCGFRCTVSTAQVAPGKYAIYVANPYRSEVACRLPQEVVVE
ncbi:MAG TPA: glycosyltransferase family 2 protein [Rhodanobacteraceae bacterium]